MRDRIVDLREQARFVLVDADEARRILDHELHLGAARRILRENRRRDDVAGGDQLDLPRQERLDRRVVVLEALDRRVRRELRQRDLLERAARGADRLAGEVGRRAHLHVGRPEHALEIRGVCAREVDDLLAFRGLAERRDHHVDLVGRQVRNPVRAVHGHQLQLDAERLGEESCHVDVVALRLHVRADRTERRIVLGHRDAQRTVFRDGVERIGMGRRGGEQRDHGGGEQRSQPSASGERSGRRAHGESSLSGMSSSGSAQRLRGRHHSSKNRAIAVKRLPHQLEAEISATLRRTEFLISVHEPAPSVTVALAVRAGAPNYLTGSPVAAAVMRGFEHAQSKFAFRLWRELRLHTFATYRAVRHARRIAIRRDRPIPRAGPSVPVVPIVPRSG
ncbi:hypothetical protein BO443_130120 [Burkholderia orbicola]